MARKPKEIILEQEYFALSAKRGGGLLNYEVRGYIDYGNTVVTRYNLAYINHLLYQGDHGRVLGYDNAHGYHHRHYFGLVEPVPFTSYEETLKLFQRDWQILMQQLKEQTS